MGPEQLGADLRIAAALERIATALERGRQMDARQVAELQAQAQILTQQRAYAAMPGAKTEVRPRGA